MRWSRDLFVSFMRMNTPIRVAVVGYGTAGQALAVALSRDGHRIEVFERVPVPGRSAPDSCCSPLG